VHFATSLQRVRVHVGAAGNIAALSRPCDVTLKRSPHVGQL
jgi:hypothetical protein